jgi:hypothetical protein
MLDSWRRDGYTVMVIDDLENPDDATADVRLVFDDGDRYSATFYSLKRVVAQLESKRGEKDIGRRFFAAPDMIVVEHLTLPAIAAVMDELVGSGEYQRVMQSG